ncbi:MAG: hypothetical protein K2K92_06480 [Duncaniella sp.]|nr:hypothetical protein [Duncaniella sp.]
MNKAIYIGELTLHVSLASDGNATTRVGDRAVAAAMIDAGMGVDTMFLGEAAADSVGDHIVSVLNEAKIDTSAVDRYTEGGSPVTIASTPQPDDDAKAVVHSAALQEPVNPVWPRINEGDVMVYGSFMALDKRNHGRIIELVNYAKARKAETVYLPYFDLRKVPRTTRVMPEVWECFEAATMVIATTADFQALFPGEAVADAYKAHILFYCPRCMVMDYDSMTMHFFQGDRSWSRKCHTTADDRFHWTAGAVAGAVRALTEGMRDPEDIMERADETAHSRLSETV